MQKKNTNGNWCFVTLLNIPSRMPRAAKRIYNSQQKAQHVLEQKKIERDTLKNGWALFVENHVIDHAMNMPGGRAWFVTLTTQYSLSLKAARRAVHRFSEIAKRKGNMMTLCWFAELHELKDGWHLHALVASNANRADLNEIWAMASRATLSHSLNIEKENEGVIFGETKLRKVYENRSDFGPLKKNLKGGSYASKYITKSGHTTDYDIIL